MVVVVGGGGVVAVVLTDGAMIVVVLIGNVVGRSLISFASPVFCFLLLCWLLLV